MVVGGDRLGHQGHAHDIRAKRAEGADLGGRLEAGPERGHIDALLEPQPARRGRIPQLGAQLGVVEAGQVEKRRWPFVREVEKRVRPLEIDVVLHEHEGSGRPVGVKGAHRARDDEALDPERLQGRGHGEQRRRGGSALVEMDAAAEKTDGNPAETTQHERARMAGHGRAGKARQIRIVEPPWRVDRLGHGLQPRAQQHRGPGAEFGRRRFERGETAVVDRIAVRCLHRAPPEAIGQQFGDGRDPLGVAFAEHEDRHPGFGELGDLLATAAARCAGCSARARDRDRIDAPLPGRHHRRDGRRFRAHPLGEGRVFDVAADEDATTRAAHRRTHAEARVGRMGVPANGPRGRGERLHCSFT